MMSRTLEEKIKFDAGLPIGQSLVAFTLGNRKVLALVEISNRGQVWYFTKPQPGDMYKSWVQVKGNKSLTGKSAVMVRPENDAQFMARFDGTPVAIIAVNQ